MKKIPVIITVEGGICQTVDSPQALDVLVLDFDKDGIEYLSVGGEDNDPKDWPRVIKNARKSLEDDGQNPDDYEILNQKGD